MDNFRKQFADMVAEVSSQLGQELNRRADALFDGLQQELQKKEPHQQLDNVNEETLLPEIEIVSFDAYVKSLQQPVEVKEEDDTEEVSTTQASCSHSVRVKVKEEDIEENLAKDGISRNTTPLRRSNRIIMKSCLKKEQSEEKYSPIQSGKNFNKGKKRSATVACEENSSDEGLFRATMLYLDCSQCSLKFVTKKSLEDHLLVVHKVKPFQCYAAGCLQRFNLAQSLLRHTANLHSSKNVNWCCPICQSTFENRAKTVSHISKLHQTGQFQCAKCGYFANTRNALNLHQSFTHRNKGL